ncbi:MAG: hypothetical protein P4L76_03590 [Beijerinckiaceae bacterium]|nr:hypothetical protein [Beijerinckiaceae bacterium]
MNMAVAAIKAVVLFCIVDSLESQLKFGRFPQLQNELGRKELPAVRRFGLRQTA